MFSVQAFIFLFIAVAEAIERLLIKRFFREECPREAYIEGIKALVDCDKDGTIEKKSDAAFRKIYDLQAGSL